MEFESKRIRGVLFCRHEGVLFTPDGCKHNEYLISMISTDAARKSIVQFDFEKDKYFCARSS